VLGASIVSALVAGPLGGIIIALAYLAGFAVGELAETSGAFLVVWGVLTGFFYACLPAGAFGAAVGAYVRRGLVRGVGERILRVHAMMAGAALGAAFGVAVRPAAGSGAPAVLFGVAGLISGAICGAIITSIVKSDHRSSHERPNNELQRTRPAQAMEPRR
jgi:hypothetical protein